MGREDIVVDSMHTRYQYMYNSLLVMATQCLYILLICWMPSQKDHARQKFEELRTSSCWARLALGCVVIAFTWGTATTMAALVCSCNPILGGDGCVDGCSSGQDL